MKRFHLPRFGSMTRAERRAGRFMRAPDGHGGDLPSPLLGEPAKDEPAKDEPAKDEPAKDEPAKDEPAKDEPAKDEPAKDEPAKDEAVPETYADFEFPEGVTLDAELLQEFVAEFKDRKLTQAQAQQEVDRGVKLAAKWQERAVEAFTEQVKGWRDAITADPTFGGEKLPETLASAKKVVATFMAEDPQMKEVIDQFRLGDNPGFIRSMARIASAISEDAFIAGGKTRAVPSTAEALYPTMTKGK